MYREKNEKHSQQDFNEQLQPPHSRQREEEVVKTIKTEWLSPLKHQRHAERTETLSVKSPWDYGHHLRCSQPLVECCDTRIALFKCLSSKFRLLLDLNLIP